MNRIAPGYNPSTSLLVPQTRSTMTDGIHELPPTTATSNLASAPTSRPQKEEEAPEDAFLSLKI
jgi:hypothetical protein